MNIIIEVAKGKENLARCTAIKKELAKAEIKATSAAGRGYYGNSALIVENSNIPKIVMVLKAKSYFKELKFRKRTF